MFSNLASYIFGSSAEEPAPELADVVQPARGSKPSEDEEWVVIGEAPAALTLGSLNDVAPRPSTGSTGSSNPPSDPSSDNEDMVEVEANPEPLHEGEPEPREGVIMTRTFRRLAVPFGAIAGPATTAEIRGARSAQALKLKESSKQLSGKALNRRNKAVKHPSLAGTKKANNGSMALKASGCMRNLKQC